MGMNRQGLLAAALLAFVALAAGAQAKPALKLTGISRWSADPARVPTDTAVQKAAAAAAGAYVGRAVTVAWDAVPPGTTYLQFLQKREAAGALPAILLLDDLPADAEAFEYAIAKGLIRSYTLAELSKNLPGYVARFKQYGADVSWAVAENSKTSGEAGRGRLWYIPFQFDAAAFPASRVPNGFARPSPNAGFTGGMFRDDLLKKVLPAARTEAEFRRLLLEKNGRLALDDMLDVRMEGWADLYAYGRKLKALNVKVGGEPLIPLGGIFGSSENAASALWSENSAAGYLFKGSFWWVEPPVYLKSVEASPELREQARWYNRLYREGLLDPDIFVMDDDRYHAKIANGAYGVFAWHFVPREPAIAAGRERGYGWRPIPFFYPFDMSRMNNRYSRVSFSSPGIVLSSRIAAADLPDVMRYIDWFMTEASDDLAYWGLPAWSTGTGVNRKFRPEYQALERWAVHGTEGGRDGTYYGLAGTAALPVAGAPSSSKPFAFFRIAGETSPVAPYWSYRASPAWDAKGDLADVDLLSWVNDWWNRQFIGPSTVFYRINRGWDWWSSVPGSPAAAAYAANLDGAAVNGLIARAITGPAADFDDAWDLYVQYLRDAGLDAYEKEARASLKANWQGNILQSIVK